jgi:hypothetical protein
MSVDEFAAFSSTLKGVDDAVCMRRISSFTHVKRGTYPSKNLTIHAAWSLLLAPVVPKLPYMNRTTGSD